VQGNNGKNARHKAIPSLNPKQALFLRLYLQTNNAKESVVQAGYKTKWPDRYGHELLNKPQLKAALERTRARNEHKFEVTFDDKLRMLWSIVKDPMVVSKNKIKAIEVMNTMQGHNAATRHVNINANYVTTELDEARNRYLSVNNAQPVLIESKPEDIVTSDNIDSSKQD
jgi:hypothetical protein